MTLVRLEPAALRSESSTLPLNHSHIPVQDRLEVCLALLDSLHRTRFSFSSEWLKEHSQLTGFNRLMPKMAAKPKRVQNKANFCAAKQRNSIYLSRSSFR